LKKRIAVFANAWSEKNLSDALEGIKGVAEKHDYDVFVFLSHAAPGMSDIENREEKRIYKLPELEDFDGTICFSSTMNFPELVDDVCERAKKAQIPLVSIGVKKEGFPFVGFNTEESMCEMVEHLVSEHGVKTVEFIAGPKGNENSDLRISGTRKVMEAHGLRLDESSVHYGDYSARNAMKITEEICEKYKGTKLPDAILCVNDNISMAACKILGEKGFSVPGDIIVTGFDFLEDGQVFYPALCTVKQNDFGVGKAATESLVAILAGRESEDIVVRNQLIRNESCGCENHLPKTVRIEACKNRFYEKIQKREFGWSNSWVVHNLLKSSKTEDIRANLNEYLGRSTIFGNGTTYILEDGNAELYLSGVDEREELDGYSETLQVLTSVERRKRVFVDSISRRELIPGYEKVEGVSKMYMFMPIHFQDWVFGYIVVENWLEGIETGKVKIFLDYFNQAVDKLKESMALEHLNAKLRELYTRDSLTGLFNRFGFDSEGIKVFEKCVAGGGNMVLMFTDINRMKLINDYYGHLQGDLAIKTAAQAIQKNIPEHWVAIRFGGDEFLILGQCDNESEVIEVQKRITEDVKELGKAMAFPFYLSASCGYLYFQPKEGDSLDEYVKKADEAMYEIKAYMHAQDMELRAFEEKCKNRL